MEKKKYILVALGAFILAIVMLDLFHQPASPSSAKTPVVESTVAHANALVSISSSQQSLRTLIHQSNSEHFAKPLPAVETLKAVEIANLLQHNQSDNQHQQVLSAIHNLSTAASALAAVAPTQTTRNSKRKYCIAEHTPNQATITTTRYSQYSN